ncbi:MAG: M42 family peptidase, partial [Chloroflexi bacterium]|nr:M42 family peptidase [Chloroflexota bacterium]
MKPERATKPAAALPALIRQLSEAVAVSGDEHAVRQLVLQAVQNSADKLEVDALGNVLATRNGTSRRREHVMAAAHMDEVGVMIVSIESDGLLAIEAVGGLDARVLLGKQLWVGRQRLPGVVGATPVHLLKDEDEKRPVAFDALRVDIGATSRDDAAKLVQPGDR